MAERSIELRQLELPLVPDYTVRVSARAKSMQLRVTAVGAVEVVLPRAADSGQVPAFVEKHRDWIQAAIQRVQQERRQNPALNEPVPPHIDLCAVNERWRVEYLSHNGRARHNYTVLESERCLRVHRSRTQPREVSAVLQRWLSARARLVLVPWLRQLAGELGLTVRGVSVRAQKTRWGSCNSRGDISINRALLFMPAKVVRYLFVHELCHTVHMNHSRRYWSLVETFEPDYRELDAELHAGARHVPVWAYR